MGNIRVRGRSDAPHTLLIPVGKSDLPDLHTYGCFGAVNRVAIGQYIRAGQITGEVGSTKHICEVVAGTVDTPLNIVLFGIHPKPGAFSFESPTYWAREAAAHAVTCARGIKGAPRLGLLHAVSDDRFSDGNIVRAMAEGMVLANSDIAADIPYLKQPDKDCGPIDIAWDLPNAMQRYVDIGVTISEWQHYGRTLGTRDGNELTPPRIVEAALALAARFLDTVKVEIKHDNEWLDSNGFQLAVAVGQASPFGVYYIRVTYVGDPSRPNQIDVADVNKCVTFDTGGSDAKQRGESGTMERDMVAFAVGLAKIGAAAELGLPLNLTASGVAVANDLGSNMSYSGRRISVSIPDGKGGYKTLVITIDNTDAEGRLINASAVQYEQRLAIRADEVWSSATLTGAAKVASEGFDHCFTSDHAMAQAAMEAAMWADDPIVLMPWSRNVRDGLVKLGKARNADLANANPNKMAGSIIGAQFIREFTGDMRFGHMDIAPREGYTADDGSQRIGAECPNLRLQLYYAARKRNCLELLGVT